MQTKSQKLLFKLIILRYQARPLRFPATLDALFARSSYSHLHKPDTPSLSSLLVHFPMACQVPSSATISEQPWYAAYPKARSEPESVSRSRVLELLKQGNEGGRFVLVDLRRTDYEGGTIKGSLNLPAQSLYPTIPSLYAIFQAAGVRKVIWYCGSSRGRGNRAAAWFADYLERESEKTMQSLVLEGGIKGWVAERGEYLQYTQDYDESKW